MNEFIHDTLKDKKVTETAVHLWLQTCDKDEGQVEKMSDNNHNKKYLTQWQLCNVPLYIYIYMSMMVDYLH